MGMAADKITKSNLQIVQGNTHDGIHIAIMSQMIPELIQIDVNHWWLNDTIVFQR